MIVEMLLIGGAIGLFTKRNRDRKDISDNYSTSYSNSYTSSYYAKYDCFNEEQEEEENKAQDYSYIDFENALYNHMSQDYSYSSYREQKRIKIN